MLSTLLAALLAVSTTSQANDLSPQDREFFEAKVRPILIERCYECHSAGAEKLRGGLLLDTKAGVSTGGDTGPAILPGKPEESLLTQGPRSVSSPSGSAGAPPTPARVRRPGPRDASSTWTPSGATGPTSP